MKAPRGLLLVSLGGALVVASVFVFLRLWSTTLDTGSFFGADIEAYRAAAERLTATGSPYSRELVAGPIANDAVNIPIGYFYPPPLAQVFTLLADWPDRLVVMVWVGAQVGALTGAMWRLVRVAVGNVRAETILVVSLGVVTFYPLQFALYGGNVSGWLAIATAILLVAGPRTNGAIAALLTLLKLTPLPYLAAALVDPSTRRTALVTVAAVTLVSVAVAPLAWATWISVLANVAANPMADGLNFSPAFVLGAIGQPVLGTLAGWGLALGFGGAALMIARRDGFGPGAIAAATFAATFVSPTLWDHYLGILLPLIVYAWARSGPRSRLLYWTFHIASLGMWFRLGDLVAYDGLILALVVGVAVVVTRALSSRPADERPATSTIQSDGGLQGA